METVNFLHLLFCIFFTILISIVHFHIHIPQVDSLSVDLIHRDHPKSPYHYPKKSRDEFLRETIRRSFSRASYLKARKMSQETPRHTVEYNSSMQVVAINLDVEYLVEMKIGNPPHSFLWVLDTTHDFSWIQCKQFCLGCYENNAQIFNPRGSITYMRLPCDSEICHEVYTQCDEANFCSYTFYRDQTQSNIATSLSKETFTFTTITKATNGSGSNNTNVNHVSIGGVVFGCADDLNTTQFVPGMIGLGSGPLSIINSIGKFDNRTMFSYCLVPNLEETMGSGNLSKIRFGASAVVSGPNTISAQLYKRSPETSYYVNLEGVSVINNNAVEETNQMNGKANSKKISYNSFGDHQEAWSVQPGNMIIDSNTAVTFLPHQMLRDLVMILRGLINGAEVDYGSFPFCYKASDTIQIPNIVLHFTGDADLVLSPSTTFMKFRGENVDFFCLTLFGTVDVAILGTNVQSNYLVGFDLDNGLVSFQPTVCSKLV